MVDHTDQALRLIAGDVALVRKDIEHQMAYEPGAAAVPFGELPVDGTPRGRVVAGDGPATVFFCGAYDFDGDLWRPMLDSLPAAVPTRPAPGSALRATMDLLGRRS